MFGLTCQAKQNGLCSAKQDRIETLCSVLFVRMMPEGEPVPGEGALRMPGNGEETGRGLRPKLPCFPAAPSMVSRYFSYLASMNPRLPSVSIASAIGGQGIRDFRSGWKEGMAQSLLRYAAITQLSQFSAAVVFLHASDYALAPMFL